MTANTTIVAVAPVLADDRLYRVGAAVEQAFNAQWGGPLLGRAPALEVA
jgi:aspartyl-tRNA(Asn)/glutamyl-tRNA(Gln) amidotransferase subunit A